jgi:hypothetical protein
VAIFDKQYFLKVWSEDIMTQDILFKRSVLQAHPLFTYLSELTLMSLVTEIFKERVFKKGDVIMQQSEYSPTNKFVRLYYKMEAGGKFAERIRTKRVKRGRNKIESAKRLLESAIDHRFWPLSI